MVYPDPCTRTNPALWFYKLRKLRLREVMPVRAFICFFIHHIRVGHVPPARHGSGQVYTDGRTQHASGPWGPWVLSRAVWLLRGLERLCNSSGDSGGPPGPGFLSHGTLRLCPSLFPCVTQTWTKQDKHGALNFWLIADLLRGAREEGFRFIFSQSLSWEKGHGGFSMVGLRGGRFSFHTSQAGNGQERAWTKGGEKRFQGMAAPPERGSAQPSTCSVSWSRWYTLILCV